MKETPSKTRNARGLHNDFSEQELTMTNGAMPPAFALSASAAGDNRGNARVNDQKQGKPTIHVEGVPEELVLLLEKWEGIVYESYPDNGEVSAGMGHLLATREEKDKYPVGTPVPKSVVEQWARADIGNVWRAAQDQAAELGVESHDFKIALANMSYQNGIYWYKDHHNTWGLMKEHKWEEAAVEAANSKWYSQTQERAEEFQAALRKLAGGQSVRIAEPFRKKAAEARELAAGRKQPPKAATPAHAAKAINEAVPEGKEGMKQIQAKLKEMHLYDGPIDGEQKSKKGESETTRGIKEFQQSHGLAVTGNVDAATWAMMNGKKDDRLLFEKFMVKLNQEQKVNEASKTESDKSRGSGPKDVKGKADSGWTMDWWKNIEPQAEEKVALGEGTFVDKKYFVSQSPDARGSMRATEPAWDKCRQAATDIAIRYLQGEKSVIAEELGIDAIGDLVFGEGNLRLLSEDKTHKQEIPLGKDAVNFKKDEWLLPHSQQKMAIAYIDEKLGAKIPVVVGIDHTYNRLLKIKAASSTGNGYNEGTTDHFVTLVGMGRDELGRKYYTYFEVGTVQAFGYSPDNRLVETSPGMFTRPAGKAPGQGSGAWGNQEYHISTVLIYKGDRNRFEKEIEENKQ